MYIVQSYELGSAWVIAIMHSFVKKTPLYTDAVGSFFPKEGENLLAGNATRSSLRFR